MEQWRGGNAKKVKRNASILGVKKNYWEKVRFQQCLEKHIWEETWRKNEEYGKQIMFRQEEEIKHGFYKVQKGEPVGLSVVGSDLLHASVKNFVWKNR